MTLKLKLIKNRVFHQILQPIYIYIYIIYIRGGTRDGNSSLRLGLESDLSRINKDLGLDLDS